MLNKNTRCNFSYLKLNALEFAMYGEIPVLLWCKNKQILPPQSANKLQLLLPLNAKHFAILKMPGSIFVVTLRGSPFGESRRDRQ